MIAIDMKKLMKPDHIYLGKDLKEIAEIPVVRAIIKEKQFAELLGGEFVDQIGYDIIHPELGRIEVKCSFGWHVKNTTIAFGSLNSKRNKCDYFLFFSPLMEGHVSLIHHDDLFADGSCYVNPKTGARYFRVRVKDVASNMKEEKCSTIARSLWLNNLVESTQYGRA
jgi:hypothetical protein